jgi:hypothetical protein
MAQWTVKRDDAEFVAKDLIELQQWMRSGQVVSSDMIYHPQLERWMYAHDVEELRTVAASKSRGTLWSLGILGVLLLLLGIGGEACGGSLTALIGIVLIITAVIMAVVRAARS